MSPRSAPRQPNFPAGSPPSGEPVFLAIGKLRRPHGVRGEMLMEVYTDFPEPLQPGVILYVGENHHPLHLNNVRQHKDGLLIAFEEYHTPEQVGELRNQLAMVLAADRPPLPQGEYYHHQLLGLRVVEEDGHLIGKITEVLATGANDVYIVQPENGGEILLPAIDDVILRIDLPRGEMRVHLLAGLLPIVFRKRTR